MFARHGYVFLWLHRQGTGLSSAQGVSDGIKWRKRSKPKELKDAIASAPTARERADGLRATAALARLRARDDVDTRRIGVVGHSFGGSLSVLMAARDSRGIRAVVIFGGAAGSWTQSTVLSPASAQLSGTHVSARIFHSRRKRLLNRTWASARR